MVKQREGPFHRKDFEDGDFIELESDDEYRIIREERKKSEGKAAKKQQKQKDMLSAISEYSLSGFLNDEPDLYCVANVKVRY